MACRWIVNSYTHTSSGSHACLFTGTNPTILQNLQKSTSNSATRVFPILLFLATQSLTFAILVIFIINPHAPFHLPEVYQKLITFNGAEHKWIPSYEFDIAPCRLTQFWYHTLFLLLTVWTGMQCGQPDIKHVWNSCFCSCSNETSRDWRTVWKQPLSKKWTLYSQLAEWCLTGMFLVSADVTPVPSDLK